MANLKFESRRKKHDTLEDEVMDIIREYTTRRHLPDRWVSFGDIICPFDLKNSATVEDSSYDEYFRLTREDDIPVWIIYRSFGKGPWRADWIYNLNWDGPKSPSKNSTSGDPYYIVSGGRELEDFLKHATSEVAV